MTDYRGCAWSRSAGPRVLTSSKLQNVASGEETNFRGALSLSRAGDVVSTLDQSVRLQQSSGGGWESFPCRDAVTQAERLSGKKVATVGAGSAVSVYTWTGILSGTVPFGPESEKATCLEISDDCRLIAVGCAQGSVYLASTEDFAFRLVDSQHAGAAVRKLRIISDNVLVSGGDSGVLRFTDIRNSHTQSFAAHQGRVTALEGRAGRALSAGQDGKIFLYEHGKALPVRVVEAGHPVLGLALSPDGKQLLVCGPEAGQRAVLDIAETLGEFEVLQEVEESDEEVQETIATPPLEEEEGDETMKLLYGEF